MDIDNGNQRIYHYVMDKEGMLFFNGNPIDDPWTFRLFQRNLEVADDGRYVVACDGELCFLDVEDVPYVVNDINIKHGTGGSLDRIDLIFAGGYKERLDPLGMFVGDNNILYCRVRKGRFKARFNRKTYYNIAKFISSDDEKNFFITLRGQSYQIGTVDSNN